MGAAPSRLPTAAALAFGSAVLAAYLALTPPVPGDGDSGEFTLVLARAALAHPTGYPLYTLLGHAFCRACQAAGMSVAYAAGAWSALGGALAALFVFLLADALVGSRPDLERRTRLLLVASAATLFAFNPMVSFEATHAEVYAWHLAWVAGAALLFVRFADEIEAGAAPSRVTKMAVAWGLVSGAGMAHHRTAVFFAAPMSLVLAWRFIAMRPFRFRPILAFAAAFALPLVSYAFVFWRVAHPSGADWGLVTPSPAGALDHIRATSYQQLIFGKFTPSDIQQGFLVRWIYPWLGLGVGLLAVAVLLPRAPRGRALPGALLAGAVANILFAFKLLVGDPSSYFLAPIAVGLSGLAPAGAALAVRLRPRTAFAGACVIGAAALVAAAMWIGIGCDRRAAMIEFDARIRRMWGSIPAGPGIVFWNNDMFHRLRALQILEGSKPEIGVWHTAGLPAPIMRDKFRERHGLDPLEGVPGPTIGGNPIEYFRSIHRSVNRRTPLPVYEFHPEHESVRLLRKPSPGESR